MGRRGSYRYLPIITQILYLMFEGLGIVRVMPWKVHMVRRMSIFIITFGWRAFHWLGLDSGDEVGTPQLLILRQWLARGVKFLAALLELRGR